MKVVEGTLDVGDTDGLVAALDAVGDDHDCAVQAFDARMVAGERHLAAAVEHANRSVERGENVARDRAVEILLYAAGRRQISRALSLGVDPGETPAAVVVDGADEAGAAAAVRDLDCLDSHPTLDRTDEAAVAEFFGVTDAERAATDADLGDLVRERVALLDVEK
ncbi:MAG: KEOPS complex subunit Cgi121 [Halobacteriaceae archaeon]